MKIFLPITRSLLKLAQHLGIAVNDTKLRELEGEKEVSHRLGGKVTTIKGEFKQQDCKLCLCIYCLFYIIVITKKKLKYFE